MDNTIKPESDSNASAELGYQLERRSWVFLDTDERKWLERRRAWLKTLAE